MQKAYAALGTSSLGGAITTLVLNKWWPDADLTTAMALLTVINTVLSTAAVYLVPNRGATS